MKLLILLSLFFSPPTKAGDCDEKLQYGALRQRHPYFWNAGYDVSKDPKKHTTMICGPVCVSNLAAHVRAVRGLPTTDPYFETEFLIHAIAPTAGVRANDIIQRGMFTAELGRLIKNYFDYLESPVEVIVSGVEATDDSRFPKAAHKRTPVTLDQITPSQNKAVVLLIDHWDNHRLGTFSPDETTGWLSGHFVLVSKLEPSRRFPGWYDLEINNPACGLERPRVRPIELPGYGVSLFEFVYPDVLPGQRTKRVIVNSAIQIKL